MPCIHATPTLATAQKSETESSQVKLKFKNMVRRVSADRSTQQEAERRNSDAGRRPSKTFDSATAVANLKVKRIQQLARAADTEDTDASVRTVLSIAKHQQAEMKALRKQNSMLEEKLDRCLKLLGPADADGGASRGRRGSGVGGANGGGRMTPRMEGRMTPRMDLLDDEEDDIETFTFDSPDLVASNTGRQIRSRPGSPGRGESATGGAVHEA
jgi:hypothetical protein